MLIRTGLFALALTMAAPLGAQAQVIDLGGNGPSIDLRSNKQRQKENYREQMAREQYREDANRGGRYRERDRDYSTGSVRRYEERSDYGRGRGGYDRY
jgi:hypothetical protein